MSYLGYTSNNRLSLKTFPEHLLHTGLFTSVIILSVLDESELELGAAQGHWQVASRPGARPRRTACSSPRTVMKAQTSRLRLGKLSCEADVGDYPSPH